MQGDDPHYLKVVSTPKHYAVHSGPEIHRHKARRRSHPDTISGTPTCRPSAPPSPRATPTPSCAPTIASIKSPPAPARCSSATFSAATGTSRDSSPPTAAPSATSRSPDGHHYSGDRATGSAAGILAGTDTDCGTEYLKLTDTVHKGLLTEVQLDVSVKRLFTARMKLGMFDPPQQVPFSAIPYSVVNSPEHAELALRAARESMVLLKNENHFLPLHPGGTPDHRRHWTARRLAHRA